MIYSPHWIQNLLVMNSRPHKMKGGRGRYDFTVQGLYKGSKNWSQMFRAKELTQNHQNICIFIVLFWFVFVFIGMENPLLNPSIQFGIFWHIHFEKKGHEWWNQNSKRAYVDSLLFPLTMWHLHWQMDIGTGWVNRDLSDLKKLYIVE